MNSNENTHHLLKWTIYIEGCQYIFSSTFLEKKKKSHSKKMIFCFDFLCIGIFQLCTVKLKKQTSKKKPNLGFKSLLKHYRSYYYQRYKNTYYEGFFITQMKNPATAQTETITVISHLYQLLFHPYLAYCFSACHQILKEKCERFPHDMD